MDALLTRNQIADYLHVSRNYLDQLSRRGMGPPYIRIGDKAVRYDPAAVAQWLADRSVAGGRGRVAAAPA